MITTMKKTYIIPQMKALHTEQHMPIAASLPVDNNPINNEEGDVKYGGDWEIFDYGEED